MTATFDPSLSNAVSQVRQYLGDTTVNDADVPPEVQDETITAYLATKSVLSAAAQLARDIAAKYAGMVDITVDHQLTKASQRYAQYMALALYLEDKARQATTLSDQGSSGIMVTGVGDCRGPFDLPPGAPIIAWPFGFCE